MAAATLGGRAHCGHVLVMLLEGRAGWTAPILAKVMLGLGVAATVVANVAYGAAHGPDRRSRSSALRSCPSGSIRTRA
jgi:hypothetical protein